MKGNLLWALAACGLILGCNQAQSPQDVQQDVAEARQEGQQDVQEAQNEAQNEMAEAQQDMADEQRDQTDMGDSATAAQDASRVAAENEYKIAVAQAEANHKVETEKCEALAGDAQADCKERADSELERAKREAERRRDGSG
ncbi:MAG TPA: hypothetical protein VF193_01775 [Steroidobacter sp.]